MLLIYEVHVKGFTQRRPASAKKGLLHRTYAGLRLRARAPRMVLGTSEPAHHDSCRCTTAEGLLHDRGLTNYWGYSSIGYLAPCLYAAGGAKASRCRKLEGVVKALHEASIE